MGSISFDRIADRYDKSRGGRWRARNVVDGVAPHLVAGPVFEVGVGTGLVSGELRERGWAAVGVDLSDAMLRRALDRLGPCVARGDAHHLPVRSRGCPNVLYVWVLHLVGDLAGALAEARRVLVDGGRVVAVTNPSALEDDEIEAVVDGLRSALRRPALTADDLVGLAPAVGFTLVARDVTPQTRTFSYLWDVDADTWDAVVQPATAALRALPDPDRERVRSARQDITVFAASVSAAESAPGGADSAARTSRFTRE
jgi:SAM-dependent methyltransferase